jgi:hypothetical protein
LSPCGKVFSLPPEDIVQYPPSPFKFSQISKVKRRLRPDDAPV